MSIISREEFKHFTKQRIIMQYAHLINFYLKKHLKPILI